MAALLPSELSYVDDPMDVLAKKYHHSRTDAGLLYGCVNGSAACSGFNVGVIFLLPVSVAVHI